MDHSQTITTPLHCPSPSNKSRISIRSPNLGTSYSIPPPTSSDKNNYVPNVPTLTHPPAYNESEQFMRLRLVQAEAKIAELQQYKDMYNAMLDKECDIAANFSGDELSYLKARNAQLVKVLKQVKAQLAEVGQIKMKTQDAE